MADTHRRVKLYALNAERQWDDRGTGHVSSSYVESLKGMSLQVRAESDGSILLESKIQPDTAYQKQQVSHTHPLPIHDKRPLTPSLLFLTVIDRRH